MECICTQYVYKQLSSVGVCMQVRIPTFTTYIAHTHSFTICRMLGFRTLAWMYASLSTGIHVHMFAHSWYICIYDNTHTFSVQYVEIQIEQHVCVQVYLHNCVLCMCVSLSLSYIYIYIYTYIHMCVYVYVYVYIYIDRIQTLQKRCFLYTGLYRFIFEQIWIFTFFWIFTF